MESNLKAVMSSASRSTLEGIKANSRRTVATILAVATALVLVGTVSQATAATYKAKDGRVRVSIKTKGHHVKAFKMVAPASCKGIDTNSVLVGQRGKAFHGSEPVSVRIKSNGRFHWGAYIKYENIDGNGHGSAVKSAIQGHVTAGEVKGKFRLQTIADVDNDLARNCWSGKSRKNPWVKFVAKR